MSKPAFDPNQPFEPKGVTKTDKPAFDPGKPYEAVQPDSPLMATVKGLGKTALKAVATGAEYIDRYTGAPTRSAIESVIDNPGAFGQPNLAGAATAFKNQFGQPTESAPTGKDIAKKLGASERPLSEIAPGLFTTDDNFWRLQLKKGGILDVSPAGAAGLAIDIGADPTLVAGKAKSALKAVPGAKQAIEFTGKAAAKLGNALTGLPEETIRNYAAHADEVDDIVKQSGGDVVQATQEFKDKLIRDVRQQKREFGKKIGDAVSSAEGASVPSIDARPIFEALEKAKSKLDPDFDARAIQLIEDFESKVAKKVSDGQISLSNLQKTKEFLQEHSSRAFQRDDGKIFNAAPDQLKKAALAANNARFEARQLLDVNGPPQLKEANAKLAELHRIEDNLDSKMFLRQSSSPNKVFTAGTGENARGSAMLRRLSKATGKDLNQEALNLATASQFGNAKFVPRSSGGTTSTSRTLSGPGVGGGLGYMVAGPPGAAVGAALGGALTSPAALKQVIRAGRFPTALVERVMGGNITLNDAGIAALYEALRTPAGREAIQEYMQDEQSRGGR